MKKNSPFRNPKALLTGAAIGIAVWASVMAYYAVRGPEYAEARPGSVIVRPIVKDNAVKRLTTATLFGIFGFVFGVRFVGRRKKDDD